ncbi:COG4315 family predicted lipoprotein [Streptomyces montanisoli]|uniref:Lipoprotein n=1 Tax=Streptomyces montanisoli TaxID=2798581 RepID=A0A940MDS2_9ACTN|nr:hypothetical protein [Streptomyces montanisoli]MBP0456828.1 hypothetical protein [Streptomyces montanisoli]
MKKTAVRAAAVVAAALFASTATACSSSGSSTHHKGDTAEHVKAAADSASPSSSMSAGMKDAAATIMTSKVPGLGEILVDSKGHTLYMFAKDTTDKSMCTGACAKAWPPAIVTAKPKAGTMSPSPSMSASMSASASASASMSASPSPSSSAMVKESLLGTVKRSDGTLQATYDKHPLYYFAEDKKAGEALGQGSTAFGAKWYVLDAQGKRVTAMPMKSASPSSTGTPTMKSSSSGSSGSQY